MREKSSKKNRTALIIILVTVLTILALGVLMVSSDLRSQRNGESDAEGDPHPNMSHLENELYATPDNPVVSPSGAYLMKIESGCNGTVYYNRFVIYEIGNAQYPLFESPVQYRTRDRLLFTWTGDDDISVYSGDTGTSLWVRENHIWAMQ